MADRVRAWLRSLPPDRLQALAAEYAEGLFSDGLTVLKPGGMVPISPTLTPEVIDDAALARLVADAELLLGAAVKTAIWTLGQPTVAERLYAGFTPLEWEALRRDPARLARVATARVDSFPPASAPRALELNATIPAMQGYSDLIAHRWLRLVARERGIDGEALVARNGSNTAELLASLLSWYAALGGKGTHPSILIVSRRDDSQTGELRHYQRAFTAAGHRALHVYVDELDVDGAGRVGARGERFDLLYRHIFARRVEPGSVLARLLVDPGPNIILNPVLSPLEVKGLLAVMHAPPEGLLSDDERQVIERAVPWTRLCLREPGTLPDGSRGADIVAWAAAHPGGLVLKRSWDYGGKGVFIGSDADGPAARDKMTELFGESCRTWEALVGFAAVDPNTWVLQELVPPVAVSHLLVERDAQGRPTPAWREVFVDLNAYACTGGGPRPTGGVCRASGSKIVNIASGGGLAPFLRSSVVETLFP
jgi:hypothetical protein